MERRLYLSALVLAILGMAIPVCAQSDVTLRLDGIPHRTAAQPPNAVAWLKPLGNTPPSPFRAEARYRLLQKKKMFIPHLLIVPVGAVVSFPNEDPFYHNVFSLFDGKRFDLGLYEAGSTKDVTFSREGISYIFCNIHPQMSGVVLSLSTSLYAVADTNSRVTIHSVPAGDYELHIWVEGGNIAALNRLVRRVHVGERATDLGSVRIDSTVIEQGEHTNMFGQKYSHEEKPIY